LRARDILSKEKRVAKVDLMGLVAHSLGVSKEALFVGLDKEIEEGRARLIEGLVDERAAGRPLAYITNVKEFFSEEFFVDGSVLVPRPETEELVEEALRLARGRENPARVLDMGTGSGAIGVIMAKKGLCRVLCVDSSADALRVARKNAKKLCAGADISFICSDLFESMKAGKRFDLVCANLPYIPTGAIDGLAADVKDFEPRIALDGGEDGLDLYRRLFEALPQYLSEGGRVICEMGGGFQTGRMEEMLRSIGMRTEIKKDLSGRERVIVGSWINS